MSNVKTAISLQKSLFDQVEALASEMKIPRSRLFALAMEDFIRRYQNKQLLEQINKAYEDAPNPSEQTNLRRMLLRHRRMVEGEW